MRRYAPMELAQAYLRTGELVYALEALDEQLAQHPDDDDARRLRGQLRARVGNPPRYADALADYQAICNKTAEDYVQLSIIHQHMGDIAQALASMAQARVLDPSQERYAERMVHLHVSEGALAAALAVVQQQRRGWRWQQWEGDLSAALGDPAHALTCYESAIQGLHKVMQTIGKTPMLLAIEGRLCLRMADALRRTQRLDEARVFLAQARRYLPPDATLNFLGGLLTFLAGDRETGINTCKKALQQMNDHLKTRMLTDLEEDPALAELRAELTL